MSSSDQDNKQRNSEMRRMKPTRDGQQRPRVRVQQLGVATTIIVGPRDRVWSSGWLKRC